MRFLGGLLKFFSILIMIAGTALCTILLVTEGVMGENPGAIWGSLAIWVGVLLVGLYFLAIGAALTQVAKLRKRVDQLEQRLWTMTKHATAPVATAEAGEGASDAEAASIPAAPVMPAEPEKKQSKVWIPIVIAVVLVLAIVITAVAVTKDRPTDAIDDPAITTEDPFEETMPLEEILPVEEPKELLTVGQTVDTENHSFVVEEFVFSSTLKEKRGNVTYNHSDGHYLAIKLNFTNLATEEFEQWSSDRVEEISMRYQDKYDYEGDYWCPVDDIVPLANDTVYITYAVPESMAEDTTGSIVADFTLDGIDYRMVIQEGDGSQASVEEAAGEDGAAEAAIDGNLTIGAERTDGKKFSFVLSDVYYTAKPSEKQGNVTRSYGNGSYYLVCKLDFTNLDSEVMEDWGDERVRDLSLSYAGKYTYEGEMWIPNSEIVPLANGNVYLLFEVPESVEDSADSLIATFTVDGVDFTVDCRA